jgi:predicted phage tail component-like protein
MAVTINGVHDSQIPNLYVYVRSISPIPSMNYESVFKNGEMLLRKAEVQGRQISLSISSEADRRDTFYNDVAQLGVWLFTQQKVKIQLDDDDRYYLGIIENADNFDNLFRKLATGSVSILCDGYRYRDITVDLVSGVQKSFDNVGFDTNLVFTGNINGSATLTVNSVSITVNGNGALVLDLDEFSAKVGGVSTNNVSGDCPVIINGTNIAVANTSGTLTYRERMI